MVSVVALFEMLPRIEKVDRARAAPFGTYSCDFPETLEIPEEARGGCSSSAKMLPEVALKLKYSTLIF